MAKYEIQGVTLESIANAIREKTGSTEKIVPEAMANEIENIMTGVDTSDATAAAINIESGYSAYVNGEKVEGSLTLADMVPDMEKPASATEILEGYQAVGADGSVVTGTLTTSSVAGTLCHSKTFEGLMGLSSVHGIFYALNNS